MGITSWQAQAAEGQGPSGAKPPRRPLRDTAPGALGRHQAPRLSFGLTLQGAAPGGERAGQPGGSGLLNDLGRSLCLSPPRDTEVQRQESAPLGGHNCLQGGPVSSPHRSRPRGLGLCRSTPRVPFISSPPPGGPQAFLSHCDTHPSEGPRPVSTRPRRSSSEDTGQPGTAPAPSAERVRRSCRRLPPPTCPRWAEAPWPQAGAVVPVPPLQAEGGRLAHPAFGCVSSPLSALLFFRGPGGRHCHTLRPARAVSRVPGALASEGPRRLACWARVPLCRECPAGHGACPSLHTQTGSEGTE